MVVVGLSPESKRLDSIRNALESHATPGVNGGPGTGDSIKKRRIMFEAIIDPILFGLESNQDAGGLPVTGNHDVAVRGEAQVARQIILDHRQRDFTGWWYRARRATLALRLC